MHFLNETSRCGWKSTVYTLYIDPRGRTHSRPVVITIFAHGVCPSALSYVRPHFSKSCKTKQLSSKNNDRYYRVCMSGQVDHWWHSSLVCVTYSQFYANVRLLVWHFQKHFLQLHLNLYMIENALKYYWPIRSLPSRWSLVSNMVSVRSSVCYKNEL